MSAMKYVPEQMGSITVLSSLINAMPGARLKNNMEYMALQSFYPGNPNGSPPIVNVPKPAVKIQPVDSGKKYAADQPKDSLTENALPASGAAVAAPASKMPLYAAIAAGAYLFFKR